MLPELGRRFVRQGWIRKAFSLVIFAGCFFHAPAIADAQAPATVTEPVLADAPSPLTVPVSPAAPIAVTQSAEAEAPAQGLPQELEDFGALSLEELLNVEIQVASRTGRTLRETPGIVTVLTRDEIRAAGARDLVDALRLVPGFDFGTDVQGIVGIGVRGLWGHEGKVLLLIDGVEMNEHAYSTLQMLHHYPLQNVERVEIIRGPGSVMYGGFAELAVIHIITSGGKELQGLRAVGRYGRYATALGSGLGTIAYGAAGSSLGGSIALTGGRANASEDRFHDLYGNSYRMPGQQTITPAHANFGLQWEGLSLRYIFDEYRVNQRDAYSGITSKPVPADFRTHGARLAYSGVVGDWLTLLPEVVYAYQEPWHAEVSEIDPAQPELAYDGLVRRGKAGLSALLTPTEHVSVLGGGEFIRVSRFATGRPGVLFRSEAGFAEATFHGSVGSLFAGVRHERHSEFGDATVPRAGGTLIAGDTHAKLLYSRAYRTPSAENKFLSLSGTIKPELTTVYEMETGWRFAKDWFIVGNGFWQEIDRVITYSYDAATLSEGYDNGRSVGTFGAEAELRYQKQGKSLRFAYAFHKPHGVIPADFEVPGRRDSLLAFAPHKVSLLASANVLDVLTLAPSVVWLSRRWTSVAIDAAGEPVVGSVEASLIAAFFAYYRTPIAGLTLGAGVHNILDQQDLFLQPYLSTHGDLPGRGREFVANITYEIGL